MAAQSVDEIRHVLYKRSQFADADRPTEMSRALARTWLTGQSRLLDLSEGTDYANALLWCFKNRQEPGEGSLAYWPPTHRQISNLTGLLGKAAHTRIALDSSEGQSIKTLEAIMAENRDQAIRDLGDQNTEITNWSREIVTAALSKSGAEGPVITGPAVPEGIFVLGEDEDEGEEDAPVSRGGVRDA